MSISIPLNTTLQYSSSSSSSLLPSFSLSSPITSSAVYVAGIRQRCLRMATSCVSNAQKSVLNGATDAVSIVGREQIRLGLPSKGRMAADSLDLLKVSVLGSPCVSLENSAGKFPWRFGHCFWVVETSIFWSFHFLNDFSLSLFLSNTLICNLIAPYASFTFSFLIKDCQLFVKQVNPRQYVAQIPQVCMHLEKGKSVFSYWFIIVFVWSFSISNSNLIFLVLQLPNTEVWFQRPKDIVRKLLSGDLDLGIVGLDIVGEFGQVYEIILMYID